MWISYKKKSNARVVMNLMAYLYNKTDGNDEEIFDSGRENDQ